MIAGAALFVVGMAIAYFIDIFKDTGVSEEPEVYQDAAGKRRVRKRGYEGLMPHMLRHTQATLLIGANTDIKTVQSRLGHSSAELTLNIYSHAIEAKDKAAADAFAALIE